MKEFKGTKGQWYVSGGDKYATIQSRNMDEKIVVTYPTIATVNSTFIDIEEFRANALLISKAPEMLEMLEEIQRRISIIISEPNGIVRETMINNLDLGIEKLIKEATQI
jgi:hypothetical protein